GAGPARVSRRHGRGVGRARPGGFAHARRRHGHGDDLAMGMNVQLDDGSGHAGDEGDMPSESVVAEINITPLTDVFLVLLIIFMVTSTALVESEVASRAGMKVVLPKANAAGPVSQRRSDPVLTVTKNGELYLGSHKVETANLEGDIRKA